MELEDEKQDFIAAEASNASLSAAAASNNEHLPRKKILKKKKKGPKKISSPREEVPATASDGTPIHGLKEAQEMYKPQETNAAPQAKTRNRAAGKRST